MILADTILSQYLSTFILQNHCLMLIFSSLYHKDPTDFANLFVRIKLYDDLTQ